MLQYSAGSKILVKSIRWQAALVAKTFLTCKWLDGTNRQLYIHFNLSTILRREKYWKMMMLQWAKTLSFPTSLQQQQDGMDLGGGIFDDSLAPLLRESRCRPPTTLTGDKWYSSTEYASYLSRWDHIITEMFTNHTQDGMQHFIFQTPAAANLTCDCNHVRRAVALQWKCSRSTLYTSIIWETTLLALKKGWVSSAYLLRIFRDPNNTNLQKERRKEGWEAERRGSFYLEDDVDLNGAEREKWRKGYNFPMRMKREMPPKIFTKHKRGRDRLG